MGDESNPNMPPPGSTIYQVQIFHGPTNEDVATQINTFMLADNTRKLLSVGPVRSGDPAMLIAYTQIV